MWPVSSRSMHTMIGASYRTHLRMADLRVVCRRRGDAGQRIDAALVGVCAGSALCQGRAVRREWELDDLVASWTLVDADLELLASKHGATRLSLGLMVKFLRDRGPLSAACRLGPARLSARPPSPGPVR